LKLKDKRPQLRYNFLWFYTNYFILIILVNLAIIHTLSNLLNLIQFWWIFFKKEKL
jgi:hypothetical protein